MKLNLKYKPFDVEQVISEVSMGGAGGIAGFVGSSGQDIADIFAGSFFPNDNLAIDLEQQILDNIEHREFTDKNTPEHKTKWKKLETNLEYDEVIDELDNDKYKNDTNKMKKLDLSDIYDIEDKKDMSIYTNETDDWKPIISLNDIYKEL